MFLQERGAERREESNREGKLAPERRQCASFKLCWGTIQKNSDAHKILVRKFCLHPPPPKRAQSEENLYKMPKISKNAHVTDLKNPLFCSARLSVSPGPTPPFSLVFRATHPVFSATRR